MSGIATTTAARRVTAGRGVSRVAMCLVGVAALLAVAATAGVTSGTYDPVSHTVVAGSGTSAHTDGAGTKAAFSTPLGMAYLSSMLYITDKTRMRRMNTKTYAVTTVAGSATQGNTDGTGDAAAFRLIFGVTLNTAGDALYVTDAGAQTIRHIALADFVVTTWAGTAGSWGTADGTGTAAKLKLPTGITAGGSNGNVYFADSFGKRVRMVTSGKVVSTLISTSTQEYNITAGTVVVFDGIFYMAWYSDIVYASEYGTHRIRKVWHDGAAWKTGTFAGSGTSTSPRSGVGAAAMIPYPTGITAHSRAGAVYVSSNADRVLWRIYIATAAATVFNNNNNDAPKYFALATDGVVLYGSGFDYRIWKIELGVSPQSDSGPDVGLIVGVVVGCTVAVAGIGVAVFLLRGKIFKPATSTKANGQGNGGSRAPSTGAAVATGKDTAAHPLNATAM